MTTTEPHPALNHRCPFCHAAPGEPCRTHRGHGRELDHPHSRRIMLTRPDLQAVVAAAATRRHALCCECGHLRTFSSNYSFSHDDENLGGCLFTDPRGWQATGTLKCSHCGTRTRHALLAADHSRDLTEDYQRYVLGGDWPHKYAPDRERLRAEYFAQFPHNPRLRHLWGVADEKAAREAGQAHVPARCGAPIELPPAEQIIKIPPGETVKPGRIDWDTELEDAETGLWWVDMDCVDCLRVSNTRRLERKRTALLAQLVEAAGAVKNMAADDVAALAEHLDRIMEVAR